MTRNLKWGYWPAARLAAAVLGFAPDGCDMRPAVTRSAHQAVEAGRLQQDEADAAWQAAYGKMGDGERMRGGGV